MEKLRLQNLDNQNAIVDRNGNPTQFFIRFIQERGGAVTDIGALLILLDELVQQIANNEIIAGPGLEGGGKLVDGSVTVGHSAQTVLPGPYGSATKSAVITLDEFGHIVAAEEVTIAGGGGGSTYTPPVIADFPTLLSVGSETARADTSFGMVMTVDNSVGGTTVRCILKAYPTPPFSIIFKMQATAGSQTSDGMGLILRDSAGGRLIKFGTELAGGGGPILQRWNSNVSFASTTKGGAGTVQDICYKFEDDGTDHKFYLGPTIEGPWVLWASQSRTIWLPTMDQIGFGIEDQNADYYGLLVQHYEQA